MRNYFNAMNCFTDAGSMTIDGKKIICAGYILVYNNEIIDHGFKIVYNVTPMYGEFLGIYMGINALVQKVYSDAFLNLFSDSKIGIYGLREWIFDWVHNDSGFFSKFLKLDGTPVANQDILTSAIGLIYAVQAHMNLFHIKSHKDPNKVSHMEDFISSFERFNTTSMTEDIARDLIYYNDIIDKAVKKFLERAIEKKDFDPNDYPKPILVVSNILNPSIIENYGELIGRRKNNE